MSRQNIDWEKYYELHQDFKVGGIKTVSLKKQGQEAIARFYKKKYNLDIEILEHNDFYNERARFGCLYDKITQMAESMQNGEVGGLVFTPKDSGKDYNEYHAYPYIVAKKDNKIILLNFVHHDPYPLEIWIKNEGVWPFVFKTVEDFDDVRLNAPDAVKLKFQKDDFTCATFALNTIKNCLNDESFLADLLSEKDTLHLRKSVIAEGRFYIDKMSNDKREKYVHENEIRDLGGGKSTIAEINFKAFYKAHYYARLINPDHLDLLDEKTREIILNIDRARGKEGVVVRQFASLDVKQGKERDT